MNNLPRLIFALIASTVMMEASVAVGAPTLSSISPNPVTGSSSAQTFTLTGSGFVSGAKVQVAFASNGYTFVNTSTNATFVSSTKLTVPITTSTTADTWKVRVQNPDTTLSGQIDLVVNSPTAAPTLSSISPNPVTGSSSAQTFTLTGSNFASGAKVQVGYASNGYTFTNTNTNATFVSSTKLTVPITTTTTADTWKVRVSNPDGQVSGQINLVVNGPTATPAPTLSSISPNPVTGSASPITFTLTGSNFVSGAKVQVGYASNGYTFTNTNTNATFVSSTQLTVPITTTTTADTWKVRVLNPDGQVSGQINLVVNGPTATPAPTLTSISPNPVTGSASPITFTLAGSNFVSGARVQVGYASNGYTFTNTNTNATFVSATQLTVPITTTTTPDTWKVRVLNPDGQVSGQINLSVIHSDTFPPSISSINPNPVAGSDSPVTFTVSGGNFVNGAKVQVAYASNGYTFVNTSTNATFVGSTQLTVPITTSTTADTWKVRVQNPDGQLSGQINLVVNGAANGALSLSSITPNPVNGANTPVTFTISGSGFLSGAKVQVAYSSNGYAFVNTKTDPSFVSSMQLTVPITTTTQADTWHVRVQNPDGMLSNQVNLVVNAPATNAAPVLNGITPNPVTGSNNPRTFTLTGSNFISGAKVKVAYASNGYTFVNTATNPTFVNTTQLTVPITTTTTADTWRVRVQNPDNRLSEIIEFVVNAPGGEQAPIVSSVDPNSVTGSNAPQTFNVFGSNLVSGASVQVAFRDSQYAFQDTNASATFVDASHLTVPITTGTTADTWRLRVRNPSGRLSNEISLAVVPPTPTSAPEISTFPNPSANIYSTVGSFVANQGSNFAPATVQTYLTGVTNAVEPLHASKLKTILSKTGSVLKKAGIVANYIDLLRADTLSDTETASIGALLPMLNLSDRNELIADAALTGYNVSKDLTQANVPLALYDADVFIWTSLLPYEIDQFVANDPVDPDYQRVVTPEAVKIPTMPSTGNAALDTALLQGYGDKLNAASFLAAATTTYNRYSTAYILGDSASAGLQLQALLNFLHLYDTAMQSAATNMLSVKALLPTAGYSDRVLDVSAIQTLQQEIATNGLPETANQFFADRGFTTDQIEAAKQRFLQFDATLEAGTLFSTTGDIALSAQHGTSQAPGESGNIATRLNVGTGDNVLIGGFIITGATSKKVIIRGIGPSLGSFGISNVLADPKLDLYDSGARLIASNNNWRDSQRAEIQDSGVAPNDELEAAVVVSLTPGAYTAVVAGVGNTTGVGSVEIYDLDSGVGSKLANISTRGLVTTGDNVMIGGTIIIGSSAANVLIRAIGPSLTTVPNALQDPTLELHDGQGNLITSNDNWRDTQEAAIIGTTIPPTDNRESAILANLQPGQYTAIVRGAGNSTGVAVVEAYQLP